MISLISKLKDLAWKYIDVILYIAGLISITYGAFIFNKSLGYIVGGIAFLISGYLTEVIAQSKKGGGR